MGDDDVPADAEARVKWWLDVEETARKVQEQEQDIEGMILREFEDEPIDAAVLHLMLEAAVKQREYTMALYGAVNAWQTALQTQGGFSSEEALDVAKNLIPATIMSQEALATFRKNLPQ